MFIILLIPFLVAMFLAINMGGSGTSPSFSAAYGSNIIRKDLIPGLFGLFVLIGALIAGRKVVLTISGGILPTETMNFTLTTIILLSVSLTLLIANLLRIPQSTSQATIFALIGVATYLNVLQTNKLLFQIIPTWFILPIISLIITLFVGKFIYNPIKRRGIFRFDKISKYSLLKSTVILTSCYVAFAIGSNNVANVAGPITSMTLNKLNIETNVNNENFLLILILSILIVAPCFGIGSSILGRKTIHTTGKEIIPFGPLGAVLISIVTATLLLFASVIKGIPTSLVQVNTAAIVGLGISKVGWRKILISNNSIKRLLIVWIIAPLLALSLSFLLTATADKLNLL